VATRRSHLILVGLILAALAGVALLAIPGSPAHKKVTLGLDLQGGLEVVLKAVPPKGKTCDAACMDRSISIMRSRIDKLGVSEPEIRKQGSNQIVIQLAGVHDVNKAAQIIGTTAQLQFYDFENDLTGPSNNGGQPVATGSLFELLTKVKEDAKILFIPYERIIKSCGNSCIFHINLIQNMMVVLGEKNLNLNRKLELLTLKGMREKIASYLISESNERNSNMFQILLNRTQLADYLNVSRTSMCRELARMKDEGLIDYYGNSFKLVNKEMLSHCLE
jgi:hypothetical protein